MVVASFVLQSRALAATHFSRFFFVQSNLLSSTETETFNHFQKNKQTLVLPEAPWSPGLQDASHHRPEQLLSASLAYALGLASSYSHAATSSEQLAENCCWTPRRFCLFLLMRQKQDTSLLCESLHWNIQ